MTPHQNAAAILRAAHRSHNAGSRYWNTARGRCSWSGRSRNVYGFPAFSFRETCSDLDGGRITVDTIRPICRALAKDAARRAIEGK